MYRSPVIGLHRTVPGSTRTLALLGLVLSVTVVTGVASACASSSTSTEETREASPRGPQPAKHDSKATTTSTNQPPENSDSQSAESNHADASKRVDAPEPDALSRMLTGISGTGQLFATLHTSEGKIRCRLFENKAPVTVANFVGLARGTKPWRSPSNPDQVRRAPFYDGLAFYRVIPDFIVQSGAPNNDPTAGPGYRLPDEFHPDLSHDRPGILGMANQGAKTAGSQFYITLRAAPHLDGRHPIFGHCQNLDVISRIATRPADANNRPEHPARIEDITFSRKSDADESSE